jgi:hypothetical protein
MTNAFCLYSNDKSALVCAEGLQGYGCVGAGSELLIAVLQLVELPVEAAMRQELLVGAALAQLALVHDEDGVRALDGREAMGNQDGGASCDHAGECEAYALFGLGVD